MHNQKYDPAMEKLKPGKHVGIVGESHIWDGPLDKQVDNTVWAQAQE